MPLFSTRGLLPRLLKVPAFLFCPEAISLENKFLLFLLEPVDFASPGLQLLLLSLHLLMPLCFFLFSLLPVVSWRPGLILCPRDFLGRGSRSGLGWRARVISYQRGRSAFPESDFLVMPVRVILLFLQLSLVEALSFCIQTHARSAGGTFHSLLVCGPFSAELYLIAWSPDGVTPAVGKASKLPPDARKSLYLQIASAS